MLVPKEKSILDPLNFVVISYRGVASVFLLILVIIVKLRFSTNEFF